MKSYQQPFYVFPQSRGIFVRNPEWDIAAWAETDKKAFAKVIVQARRIRHQYLSIPSRYLDQGTIDLMEWVRQLPKHIRETPNQYLLDNPERYLS